MNSPYTDSLFTLLSRNILSLRSVVSGTCYGCETYLAYASINGNENAIFWESEVLNFLDFKYKNLGKLFQNTIKKCNSIKEKKQTD